MSNEVTTARSGAVGFAIDITALRSGLQNVRETMKDTGGTPFLRLLKDGDWVFGSDDAGIEPGTEAVVNVMSIKHGYSCWTNRKPGEGKNVLLGEVMVPFTSPKPLPHELTQKVDDQTGDACKWNEQNSLDLRLIDGKHKGTQVVYKTTAVGGIRVFAKIIDAILERIISGEAEYLCPIISFGSDSYKHPTYGKTYVPQLDVVGWANANGEEAPEECAARLEAPKEEAQADEPELPLEDEAPRRRRRA